MFKINRIILFCIILIRAAEYWGKKLIKIEEKRITPDKIIVLFMYSSTIFNILGLFFLTFSIKMYVEYERA